MSVLVEWPGIALDQFYARFGTFIKVIIIFGLQPYKDKCYDLIFILKKNLLVLPLLYLSHEKMTTHFTPFYVVVCL